MLMEDGTHQVQFTNEEQLADFRKLQNNAHDISASTRIIAGPVE